MKQCDGTTIRAITSKLCSTKSDVICEIHNLLHSRKLSPGTKGLYLESGGGEACTSTVIASIAEALRNAKPVTIDKIQKRIFA